MKYEPQAQGNPIYQAIKILPRISSGILDAGKLMVRIAFHGIFWNEAQQYALQVRPNLMFHKQVRHCQYINQRETF